MTTYQRAPTARVSEPVFLELEAIEKRFPGVHALKGVSLRVGRGKVVGLAGENGAGKSSLIKVLAGAYAADSGRIRIDGNVVANPSPARMIDLGVAVIYQELAQAEHLSVAENIMLGRLPKRRLGVIDWAGAEKQSLEVMRSLGFDIDPRTRLSNLSVAKRQMVEIAKAIARNARLVVLDEPSAVLGDSELAELFALIKSVSRERGVSFIYITHRLKEFFDICDEVTVMRDGSVVASSAVEDTDTDRIVQLMVGRPLSEAFPKRKSNPGKIALRLDRVCRKGVLKDISIEVRSGEIVGICGMAGAGRSEVLHAVAGADRIDTGAIELLGRVYRPSSPQHALDSGLFLLPEDRKTQGAFLQQNITFNMTATRTSASDALFISPAGQRRRVDQLMRSLKVKAVSCDTRISTLSGGNQQKVLLGRGLYSGARVFLVDEPTRGVDVGAKFEIYQVLTALAQEQDAAILMVSSDLLEVLGICDRVVVMREGCVTAILNARDTSEEEIMRYATFH